MTEDNAAPSIVETPLVRFGRETCGDLNAALRREWLVTNGLGGYASGTLAGINTRRYHGLLVAALAPPVERTVLVAGAVEYAMYDGRRYALSAHEYGDGTIDPRGYQHVESFALEGMVPAWTFALADALLERRIWMDHGANTTYVRYRLARGNAPVGVEITPLVTRRDFHALRRAGDAPDVAVGERGVAVTFDAGPVVRLLSDGARFEPEGAWWYDFHHREEAARGLDDRADLYAPGRLTATMQRGDSLTVVYTLEADASPDGQAALARERKRQRALLLRADVEDAEPAVQQLTLAADQFVVERRQGKTIIAGYHWFNDWGRDTMIALPGSTLATCRPEDAAESLRAFAPYVRDGLLPNNFPDRDGADPGYNTVDASLWYFVAVHRYFEATGDRTLGDELLPVLREIADAHIAGTRYGIGVDPADGLLRAGKAGVQLTWMDAKVGDWVVTPRTGKPVEINALWYNALRILAGLLARRGDAAAEKDYDGLAERALASFRQRFVRADGRGLLDVVDGPDGDDAAIRPNQIFAVSLPYPLLEGDAAKAMVVVVARELLTSYGLRSLSPDDPAYHGTYGGDQLARDGAYHQGTVWTWLLGPFAEAHYRVHGNGDAALGFLRPIAQHLWDAGLGSVSEIMDGDAPHASRGCIAQAWGVAETLRVWRALRADRA